MSAVTERVTRKGVPFMDEHDPGWWRADIDRPVNLDLLDIAATDRCVLGQRCPLVALAAAVGAGSPDRLTAGDWDEAYAVNAARLRGIPAPFTSLDVWAFEHGFTGSSEEMGELTGQWRQVIAGRREAEARHG